MVKAAQLNILSAAVYNDRVFTLVKEGEELLLCSLSKDLRIIDRLTAFKAPRGFLLLPKGDNILLSIGNKLVLYGDGISRTVLEAKNSNFFWHATDAEDRVFVHEYGESPTGIFSSEDLVNWEKLITNDQLDPRSKHFHYVSWDKAREWLIATLGDGCLTRVVFSEDLGRSWKILYEGPWQFVPIFPLSDKIAFGMDSGIASGGIGVYYAEEDRYEFTFLKWRGEGVRHAQMCDLKRLDNNRWIASLGTPQAIVVSKDLKTWYPLHIEVSKNEFNFHMTVDEGKDFIACSTGKSLLMFEKNKLDDVFRQEQIMTEYRAYLDRLIGLGFILKRKTFASRGA